MKTTPMPPDATNSPSRKPLDLAVIGIGCLFPQAAHAGLYWANIKNAVDGISDIPPTHWNPADYFDPDPKAPDMTYARRGGFLDAVPFNPLEFGIAPRDLEATDTTQLLGLVAAKQALNDAGITFKGRSPKRVERSRVSVLLGVTGTLELVIPLGARLGHPKWKQAMREAGISEDQIDDAAARIADSYVPWQENSFPGLLGNVVAGRIANRLDLHGTNCVVDAACASSLSAIHLAGMELATGKADVVVTGGADTFNDIFMYMCFSKTPALSPTMNSKPFDAQGDGTILGEGIGVIVLKRLADAIAAGDRVYAVIKSIGTSSDGKGNAIYAPSAEGQKRCLHDAYSRAGFSPATVELVEAHGTGTKVGDGVEAKALTEVFTAEMNSPARPWCALGSVKSQIGHTKAAAGAAGLIKAVLALHYKVLPPTIKVTQPVEPLNDPASPFYVNLQMRPWLPRPEHPRRAGVSAFGFGGSNFHAVLEEFSPEKTEPDWDGTIEILPLHGTPESIAADLELLLADPTWLQLARTAQLNRQRFNHQAPARLLLVAEWKKTNLTELYHRAREVVRESHSQPYLKGGIYYSMGLASGKLAVLFPGQGSQAVGMLRDVACLFPEMLETLDLMDRIIRTDEPFAGRLSDIIYPPTSFLPSAATAQEHALQATDAAQPAIGAVSFGAYRVLSERFGVKPQMFAGHSYGELTALAAAGRLSPEEFCRVSRLRGRLMARISTTKYSEPGAMLAVFASPEAIEPILRAASCDVTPANYNTPSQTVLSGSTQAIIQAEALLKQAGLRATKLPVAAAFHSSFVADAAKPFREALNGIPLNPSELPIYSNTTAKAYSQDQTEARDLLGNQLAKPVQFVQLIETMHRDGARVFVEVGPGSVVSRLVQAILTERNLSGSVLALDSRGSAVSSGASSYAHLLAALAALGHQTELSAWEAESHHRPAAETKPAHTIPICGANYIAPRSKRPPTQRNFTPVTKTSANRSPLPSEPTMAADQNTEPALNQALLVTQQTLVALQQIQEQTAKLHQQFLESQAVAQATLFQLVNQQSALLGLPVTPTPLTSAAPALPNAAMLSKTSTIPHPAPVAASTTPTMPTPTTAPPMAAIATPTLRAAEPMTTLTTLETVTAKPEVTQVLLEVVSEKTGYPAQMLDIENTLDGDLGVDSIKRVEILSALQERLPDAPVVKPEHLGTLHTLADIAKFLSSGNSNSQSHRSNNGSNGSHHGGSIPTNAVAAKMIPPTEKYPGLPHTVESASTRATPQTDYKDTSAVEIPENTLEHVTQVLLEVVSEKTGYPAQMLDIENTLDGDLGVDSIKRVEILSALQERLPDAPVVKPEHLGTLHTLADIAKFLSSASTTSKLEVSTLKKRPLSNNDSTVSIDHLASAAAMLDQSVSEMIAPKTEQLSTIRPQLLPKSQITQKSPSAKPTTIVQEVTDALETLRHPVLSASTDQIERSTLQVVDLELASGRQRLPLAIGSEFWLIAQADDPLAVELLLNLTTSGFTVKQFPWLEPEELSPNGNPHALIYLPPEQSKGIPFNRLALRWLQFCGPKLRQLARQGATVLVSSVIRFDGEFGLGELNPGLDPALGGLAGILKTARNEWGELNYKAIDVNAEFAAQNPNSAAGAIIDEFQLAGPIEVGIAARHRCVLEPARAVRKLQVGVPNFTSKDVILVTGGARGVTADVAIALAETYQATMILTGRTPLPSAPEPESLRGLTEEAELKRAIAEHLGGAATPKSVGDFFAKTIAQRQILQTIARIEATGTKVAYFSVNITNGRQIADMIHQVKLKYGPITGLVHGAGVLADRKIEDLTPEQFDLVYSTKVDGLNILLELLSQQELKALLLFSSTTARYGRTGQLAYAAANEVLNKIAQIESRKRPTTRVVSINWGPWEGGMVTPSLRKVFESEGIGLIPVDEGAYFAVQELSAMGRAVEVIALGKPNRNRSSFGSSGSGGFSMAGSSASGAIPMPSGVSGTQPPTLELSLVTERVIDLATCPVLRSHVLDHKAVLPMVIHLEWLIHAAMQNNPGLLFHGVNDLRITSGIILDESSQVQLRMYAGKPVKNDKLFQVAVELRGKRRDGRDTLYSRAEVILAAALPKPPELERLPTLALYESTVEAAYEHFLFHGPEFQGIEQIEGLSDRGFIGSAFTAPPPERWFTNPLRNHWNTDPLVLDCAFQMMILWSYAQHGAGSLPSFAGRFRQYRRAFPNGSVKVVIRITKDNGMFARADIDFLDSEGLLIAQFQDYECVIERALDQSFRKNRLLSELA